MMNIIRLEKIERLQEEIDSGTLSQASKDEKIAQIKKLLALNEMSDKIASSRIP